MKKKQKSEINDLLRTEISRADMMGFDLLPTDSEVRYTDTGSAYGYCKRDRRGNCTIYLAKFMRKRHKKEISAVLMHEVLHTLKDSRGHDKAWRDAVCQVKDTFSYGGYEDCHLCEHPYSKNRPAPSKRKKSA